MFVRQQYRREYGKGSPHKKPIASETDARKMKSSVRLGGLKEAPASIGGEYFTLFTRQQHEQKKRQAFFSRLVAYFYTLTFMARNLVTSVSGILKISEIFLIFFSH